MSTTPPDSTVMETLAPRAAYDRDELGIIDRLPLRAGLFYGLFMGLVEFVDHLDERGIGGAFLGALIIGAISGAIFGLLFPLLMRVATRRMNDRLYAGDARAVRPAPEGYRYRLPCWWWAAPARMVNGVLYLGPEGARFDPVRRTWPRFRAGVHLGPPRSLRLELVQVELPLRLRLGWGTRWARRINIHDDRGSAQFSVPATDATYERLSEALQSLKQEQHAGSA